MSKKKKKRQQNNVPLPSPKFPPTNNEGQQTSPQINEGRVFRREEITFSGPLPPPNILERYDQISPGAAQKIISMAESQAEHRKYLEKKVVDSRVGDSRLGLYFGFGTGMTLIIAGVILALNALNYKTLQRPFVWINRKQLT